jgi:hypothetical protein
MLDLNGFESLMEQQQQKPKRHEFNSSSSFSLDSIINGNLGSAKETSGSEMKSEVDIDKEEQETSKERLSVGYEEDKLVDEEDDEDENAQINVDDEEEDEERSAEGQEELDYSRRSDNGSNKGLKRVNSEALIASNIHHQGEISKKFCNPIVDDNSAAAVAVANQMAACLPPFWVRNLIYSKDLSL